MMRPSTLEFLSLVKTGRNMQQARVKKITIGDTSDLSDIFNQMLGTGNTDMNIAVPKYQKVAALITSTLDVLDTLADTPLMCKQPALQSTQAALRTFIGDTRETVRMAFCHTFPECEWNYNLAEESKRAEFTHEWAAIKESALVNQFIVCCSNLAPYEVHFKDENKLNAGFIKSLPGLSWCPFPFVPLDILAIYNLPGVGRCTLDVLMAVLHKVYTFSRLIYNEVSSPDINLDAFGAIILENLSKIESLPALSRCKEAFRKIREALGMLKQNFGGYYREFIVSRDSSCILHSFLVDVQSSAGASPELTRQFATIINFHKKNAAKANTSPQMKAELDRMQGIMDRMMRGAHNLNTPPASTVSANIVDDYVTVLPVAPQTRPAAKTKNPNV